MLRSVLRLAGRATSPVTRPLRSALRSPAAARAHPLSRELDRLVASGWRITRDDIRSAPPRAVLELRRGTEERLLESEDLAFAVRAATVVHEQGRRQRLQRGG